jgi:hypothetical protein
MAKSFLTDINLNNNVLLNAKIQAWGSAPTGTTNPTGSGTAVAGQISSYLGALYIFNGTAWVQVGTGTVTSVSGTANQINSTGGATPTLSLITGYGDSSNPYASKTANFVLAAPNGTAAAPTFRALVAADIPTLNQNTTGSAGSVANTLTLGSGLTGTSYNGSSAVTATVDTTVIATKSYVDTIATGINAHDAVSYASTANITGTYANGASGVGATLTGTGSIVIDGYTVVTGDAGTNVSGGTGLRVLLKDQTLTDQNGIYAVTACVSGTSWTLTRAYDYDALGEVAAGDFTYVLLQGSGGVNAKFTFVETSKPAAISGVGTALNAITFGVFANGNISGTVNVNQGGTGATTLTGVIKGNGTSAFTAAVAGTDYIAPYGSTTANTFLAAPNGSAGTPTFRTVVYADLPTNVGVVARKVFLVGTGSGTTIALTHGLGTNLVTAQVYDTSTSTATLVEVDITVTSTVATATFAATTTLSNYTLVVIG